MCRPCSGHKKPSFTHNNHLRSSRLEHPPLEQCWETHYFRWLNSGTSWGREPPYCKSPCMSYSYGLYQFSILSNPIYGMSNHIYHQLTNSHGHFTVCPIDSPFPVHFLLGTSWKMPSLSQAARLQILQSIQFFGFGGLRFG